MTTKEATLLLHLILLYAGILSDLQMPLATSHILCVCSDNAYIL